MRVIIQILYKYEFGYIIEKIKLKHKIPLISRTYEYESLVVELGSSLETIFESFNPEPPGSASIIRDRGI
jgi:predicted unusual protein kinase regulating ubiquinone biosynthesis (AarF/ABC1/UbiB family)